MGTHVRGVSIFILPFEPRLIDVFYDRPIPVDSANLCGHRSCERIDSALQEPSMTARISLISRRAGAHRARLQSLTVATVAGFALLGSLPGALSEEHTR